MSAAGRVRVHPPPEIVSLSISQTRPATNNRLGQLTARTSSDSWFVNHQSNFRFKVDVTVVPRSSGHQPSSSHQRHGQRREVDERATHHPDRW